MQKPLIDIDTLQSFLSSNHLFAKKRFGQNFLIDENVLNKIVESANLQPGDTVLEIGPGLGTLTIELAKRAKHVIAIEKDRDLIPLLSSTIKQFNNVTIIQTDALRFDPPQTPYKIVANIPYYITSPLINHFLKDIYLKNSQSQFPISKQIQNSNLSADKQNRKSQNISPEPAKLVNSLINNKLIINSSLQPIYPPKFEERRRTTYLSSEVRRTKEDNLQPAIIVLLTQKEVAQKICAISPDLSVLALNVQTFGKPEIISIVPKGSFYPEPKVDSAIIKITPYKKPIINCDLKTYFKIISAGFSQKRKKIHNALTHGLHLKNEEIKAFLTQANIDVNRRAETLEIKEWETLTKIFRRGLQYKQKPANMSNRHLTYSKTLV